MLLNKEQILSIVNKEPKKLKHRITETIINSYEYTVDEQLNIIETYIFEKTGNKTGQISPPKGEICPTFINHCLLNSVRGNMAMFRSSDLDAADFAMTIAIKYFKEKYNETKD